MPLRSQTPSCVCCVVNRERGKLGMDVAPTELTPRIDASLAGQVCFRAHFNWSVGSGAQSLEYSKFANKGYSWEYCTRGIALTTMTRRISYHLGVRANTSRCLVTEGSPLLTVVFGD